LLKLFLRELPDPLLTFALYQESIDVIIRCDGLEARLKKIIENVSKLPPINKLLLTELLRLLGSISQCSDINKMSPANIGIVFGPTLIRKETEDLMNMNYPCDVIRIMVERYQDILKTTTGVKVTDVEEVTVQIEEPAEIESEEINEADGSTEEISDKNSSTADATE